MDTSKDFSQRTRHTQILPQNYALLEQPVNDTNDNSRPASKTSIGAYSQAPSHVLSFDPLGTFKVEDLTTYTLTDQRWLLQRKKIGLPRTIEVSRQKKNRDHISNVMNLNFVRKNFTRKECIQFVPNHFFNPEFCFCGLKENEHLDKSLLMQVFDDYSGQKNKDCSIAIRLCGGANHSNMHSYNEDTHYSKLEQINETSTAENSQEEEEEETPDDQNSIASTVDCKLLDPFKNLKVEELIGCYDATNSIQNSPLPPIKKKKKHIGHWYREKPMIELPTNAFGKITFTNETEGATKPTKYIRMADTTPFSSVLSLLTDYWKLLEPHRPHLVLSVVGGAKNFKLEGKKREIFCTGLIKAVKSTHAWIITGGAHVGVMNIIGEVVKSGQYIVKVKRKSIFDKEKEHMVRGIKCIGVAPWGYTANYQSLINRNLSDFSSVRYKTEDKAHHHQNISLDYNHTHFLLIDDGRRNKFSGSDHFRTKLENVIQDNEPLGLGIPVVVLLVEGGIRAAEKCSMALKSNIPVVVVEGTGRAADLLAYGVSMTVETGIGRFQMRKGHKINLKRKVRALMKELTHAPGLVDKCVNYIMECCKRVNLITIFNIGSNEEMDKYILYALLKRDGLDAEVSRLEQLRLAVIWNRPDIAEKHIFPSHASWPTGSLEDLMTMALLDQKIEFVRLFVSNGLTMTEYLTAKTLRELYNQCARNSHLFRLLQLVSRTTHHYLVDVHCLLQSLLRKHCDVVYQKDTQRAAMDDPSINYLTFEDPYRELLLWAVFSGRDRLALYLWERCSTALSAAITASSLYQGLWDTLEAKNVEMRENYMKQKNEFEHLAVEFLNFCWKEDTVNAGGLIERRNPKWGNMDCMEMANFAHDMKFISTPCCQASIDFMWRRGMLHTHTFAVIFANILPFLVWTRLFKFQNLGDHGDQLTRFQKLIVFYKSPVSKFFSHSTAFVLFLILYSYVVLFDFTYDMSYTEIVLLFCCYSYMCEEIGELFGQEASTFKRKLSDYLSSVWNRFDILSFTLASVAFGLRLSASTFHFGRILYAINTTVFYCRLFRIYHANFHLGPKLIIFYRMVSEVAVFMAFLVIFILGYGIASQSLLHPSPSREANLTSLIDITKSVFLTPYWQMYGELMLEEVQGSDVEVCQAASSESLFCENPRNYSWAVNVMLVFYLIIGNIMLLNLLIAIFTYVFDEVQENSMEIWKFERYRLIREYDQKPGLVPPFFIFEYLYRIIKYLWKEVCNKEPENLDEYLEETLRTLSIFEKECMSSFLQAQMKQKSETLEQQVKVMAQRINVINKYLDQQEEMRDIDKELELIEDEMFSSKDDDDDDDNDKYNKENKKKDKKRKIGDNNNTNESLDDKNHLNVPDLTPKDIPLPDGHVQDNNINRIISGKKKKLGAGWEDATLSRSASGKASRPASAVAFTRKVLDLVKGLSDRLDDQQKLLEEKQAKQECTLQEILNILREK